MHVARGRTAGGRIMRETIVFFVLERSADAVSAPSYVDRVVLETLCAIQEAYGDDAAHHVRVAALEYGGCACRWMTSNGPEPMSDFLRRDLRSGTPSARSHLGEALLELESKLTAEQFMRGADERSAVLIVFAVPGVESKDLLVSREYETWLLRRNESYYRAERVLFTGNTTSRIEDLSRIVNSRLSVLSPWSPCDYVLLESLVRDLVNDGQEESERERALYNAARSHRLDLSEAVELALYSRGDAALREPRVLLAHVLDFMGDTSREPRVLVHTLVVSGLRPGSQKWRRLSQDIEDGFVAPCMSLATCPVASVSQETLVAGSRLVTYFNDVCMVQREVAVTVSEGVVAGIRRWRTRNAVTDDGTLGFAHAADPVVVLKEVRQRDQDGRLRCMLFVRNGSPETLQANAAFSFSRDGENAVERVWRYTVVAPGEVSLLCIASHVVGVPGGAASDVAYSLTSQSTAFGSLAKGLKVSDGRGLDVVGEPLTADNAQGLLLTLRNDDVRAAYLERVQVLGVGFDLHWRGGGEPMLRERWECDEYNLRETLASNETRCLRSAWEWPDGYGVFPVGCY